MSFVNNKASPKRMSSKLFKYIYPIMVFVVLNTIPNYFSINNYQFVIRIRDKIYILCTYFKIVKKIEPPRDKISAIDRIDPKYYILNSGGRVYKTYEK